jgi:hypothetical protein
MTAIEDCAFGLYVCPATRLTLISLRTPVRATELDDIAMINFAEIWTIWVRTEGTWRNQLWMFHLLPLNV